MFRRCSTQVSRIGTEKALRTHISAGTKSPAEQQIHGFLKVAWQIGRFGTRIAQMGEFREFSWAFIRGICVEKIPTLRKPWQQNRMTFETSDLGRYNCEGINMTKIYLDTCCLNRPFDDQTQERIRLESEAILAIISRIEKGEWDWAGSETLIDEIEQTPDTQKLSRARLLSGFIKEIVEVNEKEIKRAKDLKKEGFQAFDALHLACAESARADVFLSTDDRLLKLAKRASKRLKVQVMNPLAWVEEMI